MAEALEPESEELGSPGKRCSGRFGAKRPVSGPHCLQQRFGSEDVDDSLEVVGEHVQAHLGAHLRQGLGEEVGLAHPCLDGPERMLHGSDGVAHRLGLGIEARLHGL